MPFRVQSQPAGIAAGLILFAAVCVVEAHFVPSMTMEAGFAADRTYELKISVDPRAFLAGDPTSLPPVSAAWYLGQNPGQVAGTHERAQRYLEEVLGLIFDGKKVEMPACRIEAINGEDNTPLNEESQEVHLLARVGGIVPEGATTFQIDFSKTASTSLIIVHSQGGKEDLQPQALFPGETSRAFQIESGSNAPPGSVPRPVAKNASGNRLFLVIAISVMLVLVLLGWRLLLHYRHHHRAHRRPRSM